MYDITIIGCGVIGASLAYALSRYDLRVLVLERENDVSMGTTKANSAIIHAGYDPVHGTRMAELNVRGAEMMEGLCSDLDVLYRRIGSLVLAFSGAEMQTLHALHENGVRNRVRDLQVLSGDAVRSLEPNLAENVEGALLAPSAAIVEPWGLCIAQAEVAVRNGVQLWLNTAVTGVAQSDDHLVVRTSRGEVHTRFAVNCAGAHAHALAQMAGDHWQPKPTRGEYYLLDKSSGTEVSRVIFQCPNEDGKGVLITPTVHGNLLVGPNTVAAADADDKRTTGAGLAQVSRIARKSVPHVNLRDCIRTFAGVRAITDRPDFILEWSGQTPRMLHLGGIKSPGLSAAPAIAAYAVQLLAEKGASLKPKTDFDGTRRVRRFRYMTAAEKAACIAENPLYGRIICRCETITEGEIVDAIHSPVPPCSLDGIKRRTAAGAGRCQGGFCGPRVMEILARELGVSQEEIMQDQRGTVILTGQTKTGGQGHEL